MFALTILNACDLYFNPNSSISMHILLVPSTYPSTENPVKGIFYRDQALALSRAGYQVNVLTFDRVLPKRAAIQMRRLSDFRTTIQVENDLGLMVYRVIQWNWYPNSLWPKYLNAMVKGMLFGFWKYTERFGLPDVIHAHNAVYGGYFASKIKQETNLPVILTEHSTSHMLGNIPPHVSPLVDAAVEAADIRLAVGKALADSLSLQFPERQFTVLGNIVDDSFFELGDSAPQHPPFVFCAVCALVEKKGLDVLIRAFAQTFREKQVVLRIAGTGKQREDLNSLIQELHVSPQVQLLGQLSRDDIKKLLYSSHVLVSSSRVETFAVNIIEALSCGRPVIATRSGGPEDFVNEQNGILVPVDNIDSLADAMKRMTEIWHRYDAWKIRQECVNQYGEKAIVRKLEGVYKQLVDIR